MELLPKNHTGQNYNDISLLKSEFQSNDTDRRSGNHNYYSWKLDSNPIKKGLCKIIEVDGRVISTATVTPKKMILNKKEVVCGELGDGFTSTDFQKKGLFTKIVDSVRIQAEEDNIDFIYGTPINFLLSVYKHKLDFLQIPSLNVFNFIYPIRISKILNKKINNKLLSLIISLFITPLLKIKTIIMSPPLDSEIKIEALDKLDKSFNKIWEKEGPKYDCIMIRNLEYIKWRFLENPDTYNLYIAIKNGEKVGYIVLKEGLWKNLKVGYIADIFTIDTGDQAVFNSLIYYAKNHFISKGFDMLSIWIQKGVYTDKLKSFGFRKFRYMPVICYINKFGSDIISKNINWYFTMSDSDNI